MNWADLYGHMAGPAVDSASADASGPPGALLTPAFSWVALVLVLVGIRILWEAAE